MWVFVGILLFITAAYYFFSWFFTQVKDAPVEDGYYSDLDNTGGVALGFGHDEETL